MKGWWKEPFLECLKLDHRETVCAELVGISDRTVCYAKKDPEFRAAVEAAHAARGRTDVDQSLRRLRHHHRRETSEL